LISSPKKDKKAVKKVSSAEMPHTTAPVLPLSPPVDFAKVKTEQMDEDMLNDFNSSSMWEAGNDDSDLLYPDVKVESDEDESMDDYDSDDEMRDDVKKKVRKKPGPKPKHPKEPVDPKRVKSNPCCPVCGLDGGSYESTVQHIEDLLKDEGGYKVPPMKIKSKGHPICPICKKSYTDIPRLRQHFKCHMEEAHKRLKECTEHDEQFENASGYFVHLGKHEQLKRRVKRLEYKTCDLCDRKFTIQSYYGHVKVCERRATNNYIMCDKCDFKTVTLDNIQRHNANMHGGDKPYKCLEPGCDKTFLRRGFMMHHYRDMHQDGPHSHICDQCGKTFKRAEELKNHRWLVHDSTYHFECVQCLQKFKTRNYINKHVLTHSGLEVYECSICHERFKNNPSAYTHRQRYHNNEGQVLLVKGEEQKRIREALVREIVPTGRRKYERVKD